MNARTVISGTPSDDGRSGARKSLAPVTRLRQANRYDVGRSPDRSGQLENRDVVVEPNPRELWVRVDLLDGVGLRGGWLVVPFEVYVPESHGELSRRKSVQTLKTTLSAFELLGSRRFYLRTGNLRPLSLIARTVGRGEDVPGPDQGAAAPKLRAFRAVQEYRCHPRPTSG